MTAFLNYFRLIIALALCFASVSAYAAPGDITTVAGTGVAGFSGDGGLATAAQLNFPHGVSVDNAGNIYIADRLNQRIRKVATDGTISTLAGTGECAGIVWAACVSGDNRLATSAQLDASFGIRVDHEGNLYSTDENNSRIRKIARNGFITTRVSTAAQLYHPRGITLDDDGNIYIADSGNHRIRKLARNGLITTVAGTGEWGYSGDNGPATAAQFYVPQGLSFDSSGNLYVVDSYNHRVRKIARDGTITTVAGTGVAGDRGDNGPATAAQLNFPADVVVDPLGNVYIADRANHRIRKVAVNGIISTVAGTGLQGDSGDNGPARLAMLANPSGISLDAAANLYIVDRDNHRIRKVAGADSAAPTGSISIENGRSVSNTLTVSLRLVCRDDSGCAEMWLSNDQIVWSPWAADVSNADSYWDWDWSLAPGPDGERRVYVRFIDLAGKSSDIMSDAIILDTTAPLAPTILAPSNNTFTASRLRPVISGTAERDASIALNEGATVLGLMTATNGLWRLDSAGARLNEGVYQFSATATDLAGNKSPASRLTYTVDATPPTLTLRGANRMTIAHNAVFIDPGVLVSDNIDTEVSVSVTGAVNTAVVGVYTLSYRAQDKANQVAIPLTRTVTVADQSAPELIVPRSIVLVGDAALGGLDISHIKIAAFLNQAQANDELDGDIRPSHNAPTFFPNGMTTRVTFIVTDTAGNRATASATVTLNDPSATGDKRLAASGTGLTIAQSLALGLDPAATTTDTDGDGLADAIEIGNPNNPYDSDNDGLLDVFEAGINSQDPSHASGLAVATGTVSITSTNEQLSNVSFAPTGRGAPTGVVFPFGVIAYNTTVAAKGESKTVQLSFTAALPNRLAVFKVDANGSYTELVNGTTNYWQRLDNNTIEIRLTDGDSNTDLDGIANGIIVDPIALAVAPEPAASSEKSGGGGGLHLGLFIVAIFSCFKRRLRKVGAAPSPRWNHADNPN